MRFNLVPLINTLCFSSLTILLLYFFILKMDVFTVRKSFILLITITLIIRLFIPFEFPLQRNLYITKIYPNIYHYFINAKILFDKKEYYLSTIIVILSLLGSFVYLCKLIFSYYIMLYTIKKYRPVEDKVINHVLKQICEEIKCKKQFQIVYSPYPATPYLFGLLHPIIVVPEITLSDNEWHYILKHEIFHFCHHDLWIRFACECLQIIYWWNPFIYILRKYIITFQEYSVDLFITQNLNDSEKLDYAHCLIRTAKLQTLQNNNCTATLTSLSKIGKRIALFLQTSEGRKINKKQSVPSLVITFALIISTLVLPNFIILEPRGELPKEIQENTVVINNENSFLVLRNDKKYDVYVVSAD